MSYIPKKRWIYIVATETSLQQDGQHVVYANVGETRRTPERRLREYKKSGGGKWFILDSFQVHPQINDKAIHRALQKLGYKKEPRKSRNTEEFLFDMPLEEVQTLVHRAAQQVHVDRLKFPPIPFTTEKGELLKENSLFYNHEINQLLQVVSNNSLKSSVFIEVEPDVSEGLLFCEFVRRSTENQFYIFIGSTLAQRAFVKEYFNSKDGEDFALFIPEKGWKARWNLAAKMPVKKVLCFDEKDVAELKELINQPEPKLFLNSRLFWGYPLPIKTDDFTHEIQNGELIMLGPADMPVRLENHNPEIFLRW